MSDAVTVLVVARDAASTIDTALASVAGQSVLPASVIVVDDASTDETGERAAAWSDLLPVEVERLHEHVGVGTARRLGIARARTGLLATLDADDAWLTDHLHSMTEAFEPCRLVFARDFLWSPGAWVRAHDRELPPPDQQLHAIIRGNLSSASVLFSRADYDRVGGYRESLRSSEDWDLYLRMVNAGVRMVLPAEPTLLYRISEGSTSAGYKTADSDVLVLEHALDETTDPEVRDWVEDALRRRRARRALARALEAGGVGRHADARAHARKALAGADAKTRAIAAAMVVAPALATRTRAAVSRRRWSDA